MHATLKKLVWRENKIDWSSSLGCSDPKGLMWFRQSHLFSSSLRKIKGALLAGWHYSNFNSIILLYSPPPPPPPSNNDICFHFLQMILSCMHWLLQSLLFMGLNFNGGKHINPYRMSNTHQGSKTQVVCVIKLYDWFKWWKWYVRVK